MRFVGGSVEVACVCWQWKQHLDEDAGRRLAMLQKACVLWHPRQKRMYTVQKTSDLFLVIHGGFVVAPETTNIGKTQQHPSTAV